MEKSNEIPPRDLDGTQTYALRPGAENFRAYVGPPAQYDVMAATQFSLLCHLGLRETHRVLDFGCGSLRAGRLLIPYLLPGNYHGLEPNHWLIEDGIEKHLGRDQVRIKAPRFHHGSDFQIDGLGCAFDFIVAQSIFSHTGADLVCKALSSFARNMAPDGLIVATFIHPEQLATEGDFTGSGWIYPGCVAYRPETVSAFFTQAGLVCHGLSWFHPRQTWYVAARSADELQRRQAMFGSPGFKFG